MEEREEGETEKKREIEREIKRERQREKGRDDRCCLGAWPGLGWSAMTRESGPEI